MRPKILLFAAAAALLTAFVLRIHPPARNMHTDGGLPPALPFSREVAETPPQLDSTRATPIIARLAERRERLVYAWAWERDRLPAEMVTFQRWTRRYQAAPLEARAALEEEGVKLARRRRAFVHEMIVSDPSRALASTVPARVRAVLPAAVLAELEQRVSGRGDYALVASRPSLPDEKSAAVRRTAFLDGVTYTAHVYGRRRGQLSKTGASLHGIALGRDLALHESPLRAFEDGEAPVSGPSLQHAVTHVPLASSLMPEADADFGRAERMRVEAFGRMWELRGASGDRLEDFEARLVADEAGYDPRVPLPDSEPPRSAAPLTRRTTGTQRVLVIRVDFSDLPGASVTAAAAQAIMDTVVKPFIENASYGQSTVATTVSTNLYRLPQSATVYSRDDGKLHADARAAASAHHALANFDRFIVAFPSLRHIPGSYFGAGGMASIGGDNIWINGAFTAETVVHELGHAYGIFHASLWQGTAGNPVAAQGALFEYGDRFDIMGTADLRGDFNMCAKNLLGWLPDQAVKDVTTSGVYRIYRFDHRDAASLNQPLALRIFRDGSRWYWIGLRQNFPGNATLTNGAYVIWGAPGPERTQLLDLGPGTGTDFSALAVGRTFTDPVYGIMLRSLARGGSGTAQYLDVEVTLPGVTPNGIAQWGVTSEVPMGLTGVVDYVPQGLLALRSDGTLVAWDQGQTGGVPRGSAPAGITNAVGIASNGGANGVVKRDGTVQVWNWPSNLQTLPPPPAGLGNVRQLAIGWDGYNIGGGHFALALRHDGTVAGWGANSQGQITIPAALNDIVSVGTGYASSTLLRADGTVVRLGLDAVAAYGGRPPPAGLSEVAAIACGDYHTIALKRDGTVVAWGYSSTGLLQVPANLAGVVAIATGSGHVLALKTDGSIVSWGSNDYRATETPAGLPRVFGIAAGSGMSCALVGGGPLITAQPTSRTIPAGSDAALTVAVSATGPVTYRWRRHGAAIPGATGPALAFPKASAADSGFYDVVVTGASGTAISLPARVAISVPLIVASQPVAQTVELGAATGLSVAASGGDRLTYQWQRNGSPIAGATNPTLAFSSVSMSDAATYEVVVSNGSSAVTSAPAPLTIVPASRLANLSIRTQAGAGEQMIIVGFVIGGARTAGTKPLLLRGAGPSLTSFGVADALDDPRIDLFNGAGANIGQNDNWSGSAAITVAGAQVGAFPFANAGSRDAALLQPALAPNAYTVQLRGTGPAQGTALAEIYDAHAAEAFSVTMPRLINLSARATVGTAGRILIAGFALAGHRPKTVLVRGIGPTLGDFGISQALSDPKLEIYDSRAVKLQENDDWGGTGALVASFASVGAFPLGATSRDAALLLTLQPGAYTAQVSGTGGTTGIALVEVYELPD